MSAAAALARDTVARLAEDHPDYAWACNATGRSLHFTSQEQAAYELFRTARAFAVTDVDMKEALWGLVLVATEIDPEAMGRFLDELASRYSDDLDVRFRVAVGEALADDLACSWRDPGPDSRRSYRAFITQVTRLLQVHSSPRPPRSPCFVGITQLDKS
jgi:hypothetical protein